MQKDRLGVEKSVDSTKPFGLKQLAHYREKGAFDLSGAPAKELADIKAMYQKNFLSLDQAAQTELLEQLLLQGAVEQNWVLRFLPKLTEEQRAQIGAFAGQVLEPKNSYKIFYNCFEALSTNQQRFFIRCFTEETPELAFMVAPFVDLSKLRFRQMPSGKWKKAPLERMSFLLETFKVSKPRTEEGQAKKNIFDVFFNDFESVKQLIEDILSPSWPKNDYNEQPKGAQELINYYLSIYPLFIIPYFPQLIEKGLVNEERAREILSQFDKTKIWRAPSLNLEFYQTQAENEQIKEIRRQLRERQPQMAEQTLYEQAERFEHFRAAGIQLHRLEDACKKRTAEHLLANLPQYRHLFSAGKEEDFLLCLLDRGLPIFYNLSDWRPADFDIGAFLKTAEKAGVYPLISLFDLSDLKSLIDSGQESVIVRRISQDGGLDEIIARYLILNAKTAMTWFSETSRRAIIDAINKHNPGLWFLNLDFVINQKDILSAGAIQKLTSDKYAFLANYHNLLLLSSRADAGIASFDAKTIQSKARRIFQGEPYLIFPYSSAAKDVFRQMDYRQFIVERLRGEVEPRFFLALIDSPEADNYRNLISSIFKKQPQLMNESSLEWSGLIRFLAPCECLSLIFSHRHSVDSARFLNNPQFVEAVAEDEAFTTQLIDYLDYPQTSNQPAALSDLIVRLNDNLTREQRGSAKKASQELLSSSKRRHYRALQKASIQSLTRLAEIDPTIVFHKDVVPAIPFCDRLRQLAEQHLAAYAGYHPEVLLGQKLTKQMPISLVRDLSCRHYKALAFASDKSYYVLAAQVRCLPPEARDLICRDNPLVEVHGREHLEKDYYQTVLEILKSNPLYPLYGLQLEKIAQEEQEKNGPQLDISYWRGREDFSRLADRLNTLALSPAMVSGQKFLEKIPAKTRVEQAAKEQLMMLLEFAIVHNSDVLDEIDFERDELQKIAARLSKIFLKHLSVVLELPELLEEKAVELELEVLDALKIYYEQHYDNAAIRQSLKDLCRRVLAKSYDNWRNWGTDAAPPDETARENALRRLQRQKFAPRKLDLEQYEQWTAPARLSLETVLDLDISDLQTGLHNILRQAIADHHIKEEELRLDDNAAKERLEILVAPLADWNKRLKALRLKSEAEGQLNAHEEAELSELRQRVDDYQAEFQEKIDRAKALLYLGRLSALSPDELASKALSIGRAKVPFREIFKVLERTFSSQYPDFIQDLRRLRGALEEGFQKIFDKSRVSKTPLIITDQLDFKTYLEIGEKPVPSCQSYKSGGMYSEGLLSYLVDPNVRIIQVRTEGNQIIARAVLRLLEDEEQKPQLFVERIYSTNHHHKIREAIINFAKEKARKLNCRLFTHAYELDLEAGTTEEAEQSQNLHSYASRAPYVYTDAGGGKMAEGKYIIAGASLIA
ncbi:hypothetical protein HZB94_04860 [Candidatus Falkowbacteria bacterium]|nr:hypothetical protein [Candidatus Falkowbacteria bacterium]